MPTLSFSYTALPYLLFFAAVFGIYAVVPKSMRAPWLLLAGFGYAILLSPQSAVFALGVLAVTYVAGLLLGGDISKKQKQAALTVSLLAIFGLLGALKYGGLLAADAVKLVNFFGGSWQPRIKTVALPIVLFLCRLRVSDRRIQRRAPSGAEFSEIRAVPRVFPAVCLRSHRTRRQFFRADRSY